MTYPIYKQIAILVEAIKNCNEKDNSEWAKEHKNYIEKIVKNQMPSGAGFDSGTRFNFDESTPDKLVFNTSFHHMDENGCYSGWTDHKVVVKPSLSRNFDLKISGRNYKDIKEYIADIFDDTLNKVAEVK